MATRNTPGMLVSAGFKLKTTVTTPEGRELEPVQADRELSHADLVDVFGGILSDLAPASEARQTVVGRMPIPLLVRALDAWAEANRSMLGGYYQGNPAAPAPWPPELGHFQAIVDVIHELGYIPEVGVPNLSTRYYLSSAAVDLLVKQAAQTPELFPKDGHQAQ